MSQRPMSILPILFIRFVENSPVGKMHYLKSIQEEEAARSGGRKVGWYWILVPQFDVSIQISGKQVVYRM